MVRVDDMRITDLGIEALDDKTIRCFFVYVSDVYKVEREIPHEDKSNVFCNILIEGFPPDSIVAIDDLKVNGKPLCDEGFFKWYWEYRKDTEDYYIETFCKDFQYFSFVAKLDKPGISFDRLAPWKHEGPYLLQRDNCIPDAAFINEGGYLFVHFNGTQRDKTWIENANDYTRNYLVRDEHRNTILNGIIIDKPALYHANDQIEIKIVVDRVLVKDVCVEINDIGEPLYDFSSKESVNAIECIQQSKFPELVTREMRKTQVIIRFSSPIPIEKYFMFLYRRTWNLKEDLEM